VNVPLTLATSSTLVDEFQVLTLAVVPLVCPVITSLNTKSPVESISGEPTVIVGATLYPKPAFVILISVTVPAAFSTGSNSADAVETPDRKISFESVIDGAVVYPLPPELTVTIPRTPSAIPDVAAAPVPPLPP
jgi:hypothetical protein